MAEGPQVENFIGGKFQGTALYLDNLSPATGQVWGQIPDSGAAEIKVAVEAALDAFPSWSRTSVKERCRLLNKVADLLEARLDEFAGLESRDQGKPVWLAKTMDIPRAVYNFRFFASYVQHALTRCHQQEEAGALNYGLKEPVGVAGLISPWNLPLYLLTFKMAPALAAGNTVVAKPSELTSVTAFRLCQLFQEAGFPPGVVNMVFGVGAKAGEALVAHPRVPIISFTGGTLTAQKLRAAAAPFCKKLSLELGGKNPAVIFDDADIKKCLNTTIRSSFLNQGEICLCTSRIFVQNSIYDNFVAEFVAETKKLAVGDPEVESSFLGAVISKEHRDKILRYVELANQEGATVECGEGVDNLDLDPKFKDGFFVQPTVITNLGELSALMTEEIFGPVVCIARFDTEEEVVKRANSVQYGLAATVWTQDVGRAHRVAKGLQSGTVWVNCWLVRDLNMAFGGYKESGIGREGAEDSLNFYTQEKTVCIQYSQ